MVSIDTTGIVDGQEIDAVDVTTPLSELETAINNLVDGTDDFTGISITGGTGAFSTLSATDGSGIQALNGSNISSGTVPEARLPSRQLADITDAGTIASQDANNVDIDGGSIDGTTIGASTRANGEFSGGGVVVSSGNADWMLNGPAGNERRITMSTSGSKRFEVLVNSQAETGGNAGSAIEWRFYADDGSTITKNLYFFRNNGTMVSGAIYPGAGEDTGLSIARWGTGWFTNVDTTNAVNVSSDARYKQDVRTINPAQGLALVLALTPRRYRRTDDAGKKLRMGFVAQEVESALRRTGWDNDTAVVQTDEETGDKSIAYTEIIAAQTAAIQALEARIAELEKKVVD